MLSREKPIKQNHQHETRRYTSNTEFYKDSHDMLSTGYVVHFIHTVGATIVVTYARRRKR